MSYLLRTKRHGYSGRKDDLARQFLGLRKKRGELGIEVKVEYSTQKLWEK
jgi:hypothetical protein